MTRQSGRRCGSASYKQAGARLVELHPMTIMQNALHSFGGDWSWVPPKANTIGPRQTAPTDYTILGGVADDVEIAMA